LTYTTLPAALARAIERTQGQATSADAPWLTELLTLSAALAPDGVLHLRPYYVAARFLEQKLSQQTISAADGAVFTGLAKPIASLFALQHAYDQAQGLAVPPGFEAVQPEPARLRSRSILRLARP
jgi:hypothetical protein